MTAARDFTVNSNRIVTDRLDRVGRAVGLELQRRIMRKTPVDTGRARANWNASINNEDGTTTGDTDETLALSRAAGVIKDLRLGAGERLFITNGLPYIARLNDGWSQQAPAKFVEMTVEEMRPVVEAEARKIRILLDG